MEVVERQSLTALRQQSLDLWQREDALDKFVELALAHVVHSWRDALHRRATGDEPVRAFLALTFGDVLCTLLKALEPVLVLPDALFELSAFTLKLFLGFNYNHTSLKFG